MSEVVDATLSKDGGTTGRPRNVTEGAEEGAVMLLVRELPSSGM